MGEALPREPPSEVRRLAHLSGEVYRCPTCGNLYERGKSPDSLLNATYDSEYVRRLRPASPRPKASGPRLTPAPRRSWPLPTRPSAGRRQSSWLEIRSTDSTTFAGSCWIGRIPSCA